MSYGEAIGLEHIECDACIVPVTLA